eukprot:scaffold230322_cov30-Tisochrysis_lutea.AAC.2
MTALRGLVGLQGARACSELGKMSAARYSGPNTCQICTKIFRHRRRLYTLGAWTPDVTAARSRPA